MNIREFALTDYEAVIKVWVEAGLTLKPSDELAELIWHHQPHLYSSRHVRDHLEADRA